MNITDLKNQKPTELLKLAQELDIEGFNKLSHQDLIYYILRAYAELGKELVGIGVLEIIQEGFGFLRSSSSNYLPGSDDIYVAPAQIKQYSLKTGDTIEGKVKPPEENEKYFSLNEIQSINFVSPEQSKKRISFESLTPVYPYEQFIMEHNAGKRNMTGRIIDLISPIGKGQRALITAPPKTGKTMMLQDIAHAIEANHPEVFLIVLSIDERPEEVTDMTRSVKGEVVSSTFDEPAVRQVQVAEMVIEKAKRLAEHKKDVVILLDSITRLARAYNATQPSSGKVLTGGVDSNALQKPKRFFGAARKLEEGGSITIIATALIETGSKMEEVIFEEFKGTGNSEIVLDRRLSDKRIFPAIDVLKSGTRNEECLMPQEKLAKIWVLRRLLSQMNTTESTDFLLEKMRITKNNDEFFVHMQS